MSDSTQTTSPTRSRTSFRTTAIITIVVGIAFADHADFLAGDDVCSDGSPALSCAWRSRR